MSTEECAQQRFLFQGISKPKVEAQFNGGAVVSILEFLQPPLGGNGCHAGEDPFLGKLLVLSGRLFPSIEKCFKMGVLDPTGSGGTHDIERSGDDL